MSLVFYRKYRPQNFSEIIGQEHVVKTLSNALAFNNVSHAYLFTGPRGSGKTTIARILAKALNCQRRKEGEFEPCDQCSSCLEIKAGHSLDLIEIDAASHRGIDEMKELKEGMVFTPAKSKYKVFIIDEAHQLTREAANALLKMLEEPPAHVVFILATTEIHKMISTIISRCQRFDFRKLTVEEIIKKLEVIAKKEKVKVEKKALELIALNASGALRDAESIFAQVLSFEDVKREITAEEVKDILGLVDTVLVGQLTDFLFSKKASLAIEFLSEIIEKGIDLQEYSRSLINYLREGLILKIMGLESAKKVITGLTKEEIGKLEKQVSSLEEKEIRRIIGLFLEADNKIKYSTLPQLPLELAIVESCQVD